MVTVEQQQQRGRRRRHEEEPVLREDVGVEETPTLGFVTDRVKVLLGGAVEDGEVNVRRRVVLRRVAPVGAEQRVRDQGGERERQRGVSSGVRLELQDKVLVSVYTACGESGYLRREP